ncbi:MAG: glycoside hydrolase family 127 protein [Prolixibacteraceae bacterium]
MKLVSILMIVFLAVACAQPKTENPAYPIKAVNLRQVKITDNFWLPKIKTIQQTTIAYAIDKCSTEGRMDNFLIAGGKMEGKTRGQMPFDDTDLYKIIEGASYSLISNPDPELETLVDSLIAIIAIGQEKDGYLTTYKTIDSTYAPASWCPAGGRWQNLACSHELYNSGHMFEAAAAHYAATGKTSFLNIATRNADLLCQVFGPGEKQNHMVPGHQIVETGLIKLYQSTGEKKYLALAKHFLDSRGDSTTHQLYGPYNQDHVPVIQQDEVVGHAVRAVYMYAGMTDIAALYNDSLYLNAVNALWENMVTKKIYLTGGIGARHDGEAFGENYELPNLTAYSETCAAIGSVYWNQRLFLLTGDVKYLDVLERTLYNGVIPGISLNGEGFFYPNPLEADGNYKFNQGACTRSSWFDCSCCPTNLIRFIPSMPNLIYATKGNELFVNLYLSNEADIALGKSQVHVTQTTNYPWEGKVQIKIEPEKKTEFTLKLRIPGWVRNEVLPGNLYSYVEQEKATLQLSLNGKAEVVESTDGFITINRVWEKGDVIAMDFPMEVKTVMANEKVENLKGSVAFEYGPLVYCAEEADNQNVEFKMSSESHATVSYHPDLLGGINELTTDNQLTLIPYYSWSNRGVGRMKVWLDEE